MFRLLALSILISIFLVAFQTATLHPSPTISSGEPMPEISYEAIQIKLEGFIQRIHDPVIAHENNKYFIFSTGKRIPFICSEDMVTWEFCGSVFDRNPNWTREINPNLIDIWAPDISYFNNRWHLYYAISTFGSQNSAIGLATNLTLDPDHPDYQWVDQGEVLRSQPGDPWNAIDPNLVMDEDDQTWLVWGSFWSGIWMRKVDPTTGKFAGDDTTNYHLADRSPGPDNTTAIEAPFIVQRGGMWYLFVSFDQCCQGVNSTYNVRVGRSNTLTGPYVDRDDVPLTEGGGTLILSEYGQWKGPGHNGILVEDNIYWMVYHAYDANQIGIPKLRIESIGWDADGWPSMPSQMQQLFFVDL
jgi:arabinan endo-1,5-alpha-L-arabinosidase